MFSIPSQDTNERNLRGCYNRGLYACNDNYDDEIYSHSQLNLHDEDRDDDVAAEDQ